MQYLRVLHRATRGVNGTTTTEHAYTEIQDLAENEQQTETNNLPGPAQSNVDTDAKTDITIREAITLGEIGIREQSQYIKVSDFAEGETVPGEPEHEKTVHQVLSRTETADSVRIIGDILT